MVTWTPLNPVKIAFFLTDRVQYFGASEGATREEVRDLTSELKILIYVGEHKNIVNLLVLVLSEIVSLSFSNMHHMGVY